MKTVLIQISLPFHPRNVGHPYKFIYKWIFILWGRGEVQRIGGGISEEETTWNTKALMEVRVKIKQFRYRPRGFQEVKVPRFHDNGAEWW